MSFKLFFQFLYSPDSNAKEAIPGLVGQNRWGVDKLLPYLGQLVEHGLKSVILFGTVPGSVKDSRGSSADTNPGPVVEAIKAIRKEHPSLTVACDVCLCAYTDTNHCCRFSLSVLINITCRCVAQM